MSRHYSHTFSTSTGRPTMIGFGVSGQRSDMDVGIPNGVPGGNLGVGVGVRGPGPISSGNNVYGHPDFPELHDIVQTHSHYKAFIPYEEKSKLLAMHQASQSNAGWYVLCVLVIYFGALMILLKRKGYLSQHHYYHCCPTLFQYCCLNGGGRPGSGSSPTFGSPDGDEHELQLQCQSHHIHNLARGHGRGRGLGYYNQYCEDGQQQSTSLTSINTNIVSGISPGQDPHPRPSTSTSTVLSMAVTEASSMPRQLHLHHPHPQVTVRVLEPREPLIQGYDHGYEQHHQQGSNGYGSNGTRTTRTTMSTNV